MKRSSLLSAGALLGLLFTVPARAEVAPGYDERFLNRVEANQLARGFRATPILGLAMDQGIAAVTASHMRVYLYGRAQVLRNPDGAVRSTTYTLVEGYDARAPLGPRIEARWHGVREGNRPLAVTHVELRIVDEGGPTFGLASLSGPTASAEERALGEALATEIAADGALGLALRWLRNGRPAETRVGAYMQRGNAAATTYPRVALELFWRGVAARTDLLVSAHGYRTVRMSDDGRTVEIDPATRLPRTLSVITSLDVELVPQPIQHP